MTTTAHRNMADGIVLAGSVLREHGLGHVAVDHGIALDCSQSVMDEHGLDHRGQAVPHHDNLMQAATDLVLSLASATDPNQRVQGVVFSEVARLGPPIVLGNHLDWVDQHRLAPHEMTTTNMAEAVALLLQAAAEELGVPDIAGLAQYKEAANLGLDPGGVIQAPRAYMIHIVTDGDPDDHPKVESLLRAASFAPIRVNLVYISNQVAGLAPLRSLTHIGGRCTDNVNLVDLSHYEGNLRGVSHRQFLELSVAGLREWIEEAVNRNMFTPAAG